MPREAVEISTFEHGIILALDPEDIPDNAASDSQDVDGDVGDGKLIGRKDDVQKSTSYGLAAETTAFIIEDNGANDLIYHDKYNRTISIVRDFNGTPVKSDLMTGLLLGDDVSMITHNKEVHIGMGSGGANKPKWAGYVSVKQFGNPAPSDPILVDAEVVNPEYLPYLHKILTDGTYIYGFEFDGDTIFRVKISDGTVETSTPGAFLHIKAMCRADGTHAWIYDSGAGTFGTVYRMELSSFALDRATTLNAFPGITEPDQYVTDMVATDNKLWFSRFDNNGYVGVQEGALFNISLPLVAGTATPVDVTPSFPHKAFGGSTVGTWVDTLTGTSYDNRTVSLYVPRLSLTKMDATHVGWLGCVVQSTTIQRSPFMAFIKGDHSQVFPKNYVSLVSESVVTSNAPTAIAILDLAQDTKTPGSVYNGIQYATLISDGIFRFYTSEKDSLFEYPVSSPTYVVGDVDVATGRTVVTAPYAEAPSDVILLTHSVGDIYLTRSSGISGVDKIDGTAFATVVDVVDGGNISIAVVDSAVSGVWTENQSKFYKICAIYDGYQFSPIGLTAVRKDNGPNITKGATVTLTIRDIRPLSPRLSAIVVLKSKGAYQATEPDEFYRVVDTIELSDPRWSKTNFSASLSFDDNAEDVGASYEALTGIPETLRTTIVNYALSATLNNQLFVANCFHEDLPDASHMLFKSKPLRFDTFDWSTDILRLPIIPKAIAAWAGRIYAFGDELILRIDPESLIIEDIYKGVGVIDKRSIVTTPFGMFWADKNNIYLHDGQSFSPIGDAIRTVASGSPSAIAWIDNPNDLHTPRTAYFGKKREFLLNFSSGNTEFVWAYNLVKKRWDYWVLDLAVDPSNNVAFGMFSDPLGNAFYSRREALYGVCQGSSYLPVTWVSKDLSCGEPQQKKKFYKAKIGYTGSVHPTVTVVADYTGSPTSWTEVGSTGDFKPSTVLQARAARVKITHATTSTSQIKSLEVLYRRMFGKR